MLSEERSGVGLLVAERSALGWLRIDWLDRVAQRSLLRERQPAEGELRHMPVHRPFAAELLSEPAVLDVQDLADSAGDSLLGAAEAQEHEQWDDQEEHDELAGAAALVVSPVRLEPLGSAHDAVVSAVRAATLGVVSAVVRTSRSMSAMSAVVSPVRRLSWT